MLFRKYWKSTKNFLIKKILFQQMSEDFIQNLDRPEANGVMMIWGRVAIRSHIPGHILDYTYNIKLMKLLKFY